MARVKRGVTAKARHKKVLGKAKGYYGARSKLFKTAKQAVIKAGQYAYRDRRQRIQHIVMTRQVQNHIQWGITSLMDFKMHLFALLADVHSADISIL